MAKIGECIDMIRRGQYEKAIWHLSRIATREPDNPEVHSLEGLAHYRLDRYSKAIEACDRVRGIGDELFQEYARLIDDLIWYGRYDKVAAGRQMAARIRDASVRAKYVKAKSLFRLGKRDEALEWINVEMLLDPNIPGERSILAMILGEMCFRDEASEPDDDVWFTHVRGPLFNEFWNYMGDRKAMLEEKFDIAVFMARIQKKEASTHEKLARILNDMGKQQRALNAIDKAIGINPLNVMHRYVRAEILRALDRRRDCDREIKEALALDMYHVETVALSGFRLCEKGYVDKGRVRISYAFLKDSLNPVTCYYQAYVLFHDGCRKEALGLCKSAMLRHPENRKLRYLLVTMLDDVLWP